MDENDGQLLALGQQILDTLTAAYVPTGDEQHALALFPGQAVPDEIVQGGQTNPLQLSQWLGELYDFALDLKAAAGTSIVTPVQTGMTLRTGYSLAARFAVPTLAADDPALPRLEALIADARKGVGDGTAAALPFGCIPAGFAEPDASGWQTFDTVVTAHHDDTSTTTAPSRPDPVLWRLHAIPETLKESLAQRVLVNRDRIDFSDRASALDLPALRDARRALVVQPAVAATPIDVAPRIDAVTPVDVATPIDVAARSAEISTMSLTAPLALKADPAELATTRFAQTAFLTDALMPAEDIRSALLEPPGRAQASATSLFTVANSAAEDVRLLTAVDRNDLQDAPTATSLTTQDSSLHVHFEHLLVTIVRSASGIDWWHPELLAATQWCVPGMRAGDLVGAASDPDTVRCRPLSLLLVRDVALTGTWSTSASELMTGAHYVGPFLMQVDSSSSSTSADQQTTIGGAGIQVIGVIGGPMPALPPSDDPAKANGATQ